MRHKYFISFIVLAVFWNCIPGTICAQENAKSDSLPSKTLEQVTIMSQRERTFLPDSKEVVIFAGKKTNVITLQNETANLPQNLGRMVFAKIPGVNLWDMDGSGTQMNIGTRGTDAHRSIEMNMRQNGYVTNSDIFGYPENHYSAPMQAVSQIQLVRGSAALQFGSQFGGMMNFVMKEGDPSKKFSLESEQTYGSFNFFNSFNAVGGTIGKLTYYAYYNDRHSAGWRPHSDYQYKAYHVNLKYSFSSRANLSLQFSGTDTRLQIAGGLTDAQFLQNARQSNRSRNYFDPMINIPALVFNYEFSDQTKLQVTSHYLYGDRSSVQFINTANVNDTINTAIGTYNPRQVDRDFYKGFTTEARLMKQYKMGSSFGKLAAGIRFFSQQTLRKQKGKGTTAGDNDLSLAAPYAIDLQFQTVNYAVFAENIFQVSEKFSVTPGFRYEVINSDLTGTINSGALPVSYKGNRTFPLFGLGLQLQTSATTQLYGNISQAYRPFLYANITPADQIGVIDPNLKDSKGYDIDLGYRGHLSDFIEFDINGFYLFYGDKIGKLTLMNSNNNPYQLTTNIGNSVAQGVEAFVNISLLKIWQGSSRNFDFRLFSSLAYTHARYTTGSLSNGIDNISLVDRRVENTPDFVERGGVELRFRNFSNRFQLSYVSDQYSDANNTAFTSTGIVGYIPSYSLMDWSFSWKFLNNYHLSGGVNNVGDLRYFSRRINMYPGPGILPGDGRSFYLTLGFKID